jgi:hypothetical protein
LEERIPFPTFQDKEMLDRTCASRATPSTHIVFVAADEVDVIAHPFQSFELIV